MLLGIRTYEIHPKQATTPKIFLLGIQTLQEHFTTLPEPFANHFVGFMSFKSGGLAKRLCIPPRWGPFSTYFQDFLASKILLNLFWEVSQCKNYSGKNVVAFQHFAQHAVVTISMKFWRFFFWEEPLQMEFVSGRTTTLACPLLFLRSLNCLCAKKV